MEYYFSSVRDVLPYAQSPRRAQLPGACRPHIAWSGERGGGAVFARQARLGEVAQQPQAGEAEREKDEADARGELGLAQLLTVDAARGKRLCLLSPSGPSGGAVVSDDIPSGLRVAALEAAPAWAAAAAAGGAAGVCYASDTRGAVYRFTLGGGESEAAPAPVGRKRSRSREPVEPLGSWSLLTPAASAASVAGGAPCGGALGALLSQARGLEGWVGLRALPGGDALVCARGGYSDVRLLDAATGAVARAFATTHAPSGLHVCSPHTVLVAEGPLATIFDLRASTAVDWASFSTLRDARLGAAAATQDPSVNTEADGDAGEREGDQQQPQQQPKQAAGGGGPPLVPQRFTSPAGLVRDACGGYRPHEVVLSVDRAVGVFDTRKFTRLATSSNVLKYDVAAVSAIAGGRACVCAGIDAEVRIIPFVARGSDRPAAAGPIAQQQQQKRQGGAEAGDAPVTHSGTFRTRLNATVTCDTNWSGGWVTCCNGDGAAAVGVSMNNEIFLAQ